MICETFFGISAIKMIEIEEVFMVVAAAQIIEIYISQLKLDTKLYFYDSKVYLYNKMLCASFLYV